jgi:hypothetical protein
LLDRIIDEVGQEKSHPLASLMDVLGVLRQKVRDGEGAVASTRGARHGGQAVRYPDAEKIRVYDSS